MAESFEDIRQRNAESSPLLAKLPGELRNQIYLDVLTEDEIEINFKDIHARTALLRTCTQIRRTCTQIREEATNLFLSQNRFIITDPTGQHADIERFLNSSKEPSKITSIVLRHCIPAQFECVVQILHERIQLRRTWDEVEAAVVWTFGSETRASFRKVIQGITRDHRDAATTLAETLIRSNVPYHKIQWEDVNWQEWYDGQPWAIIRWIQAVMGGIGNSFHASALCTDTASGRKVRGTLEAVTLTLLASERKREGRMCEY